MEPNSRLPAGRHLCKGNNDEWLAQRAGAEDFVFAQGFKDGRAPGKTAHEPVNNLVNNPEMVNKL
jgi:hypothetical protein